MHIHYISNKIIRKCCIFGYTFIFFISCNSNTHNNQEIKNKDSLTITQTRLDNIIGIDSVIYSLSDEAENAIDYLIGNDTNFIVGFTSNHSENEFVFNFITNEKKVYSGRRAQFILHNSNRYLKTKKHIFKILLSTDDFFSTFPRDSIYYLYHYPRFGVIVNARGELIRQYSEKHK